MRTNSSYLIAALWLLLVTVAAVFTTGCQAEKVHCSLNISYGKVTRSAEINPVLSKNDAAFLLLLGFGGLSVLLAVTYVTIRQLVFDDKNNLDSTFDAGGNVSASLTAVTIAAQLLWPADLQQSVTVAVKYGIAGVFWYCVALLINLSLFPLLSFKFKTKAPGAKTYLQIILARCGRSAHIVFCVFAFLVNAIILSSVLVGGIAVMQASIVDASPEYCVLLIATLCGCYAFIGGLGSTFYVSYFNALTTFVVLSVLVIHVFYSDEHPFGSLEEIYEKINCLPGPEGNRDGSYFTFFSEGAMLWAIQGLLLVTSITYCDQASWQSRIAAKPLEGAVGFLLAGAIWFACPATIGTVAGITYLAQSAENPDKVLSEDQVNSGIVAAYMSQEALGKQGGIMMLTMLTMLIMSTGSGEIMGICSIIVYDIYQTYIRPFRYNLSPEFCVLCGLRKSDLEHIRLSTGAALSPSADNSLVPVSETMCSCPPAVTCVLCKNDLARLQNSSNAPGKIVQYKCPYHGDYRAYQDCLINFKDWCVLCVALGLVPFGLAVNESGIDLNWTMMTGINITAPSFPGVIMCILWSKVTGKGLIAGSLAGLVTGISSNLLVAYGYYKGKGGFLLATSEMYAVVAGSASSITVSIVVTVVVSFLTNNIRSREDEEREWQKMRDIDNPIHPWAEKFVDKSPESKHALTRPSMVELEYESRHGRSVSIIGSIAFCVVFLGIIPGTMISFGVLSAFEFKAWTTLLTGWCLIMAVVIVVVTPVEEVRSIILQLKMKQKIGSSD